jgi:hypothetical protein
MTHLAMIQTRQGSDAIDSSTSFNISRSYDDLDSFVRIRLSSYSNMRQDGHAESSSAIRFVFFTVGMPVSSATAV